MQNMIYDSISQAKKEKLRHIPYNFDLETFHFSTVSTEQPVLSVQPLQPERSTPSSTARRSPSATQQQGQASQLGGYHGNNQVCSDPFSLPDTFSIVDQPFRAGSLKNNIHVWRKITNDPEILKLINGVHLTFDDKPFQEKLPHEIQFSGTFENLVKKELQKFLDQGIIEPSTLQQGDYLSNLFARPKKSPGEIRLILNLKYLNLFVPTTHFKMETLDIALKLMRPNMFLASIDLTNSFYHLLVKPRFRKFLKFSCMGQIYRFTSLPMGFKDSPRIFTKLMKVPLAFLRQHYGCIVVCYIDDILVLGHSKTQVQKSVSCVVNLLQMLGFHINAEKSEFEPTQCIEFLGFVLNSTDMSVSLTKEKTQKIIDLACQVLQQQSFTIRFLAKFLGNCVASFPAVEFGPYHTKEIEREKALALKHHNHDFEAEMSLSEWSIIHVQWWRDHIVGQKFSLVVPPIKEQVHLFSDASTVGWGVYFPLTNSHTGGLWSTTEQAKHINELELFSILLGCQIYLKNLQDSTVHFHTDNQVALFCLRSQGSCRSPWCNKYTAKIMQFLENRNLHLIVSYVRLEDNVESDHQSRVFDHDLEWSLPPDLFPVICQKWGTPQIDLFASRLNHQVPLYCSWKPDPHALATDAFSIDWNDFSLIYIYAPFSLLPRVINTWQNHQELQRRSPTNTRVQHNAIIVAPAWPSQPWFPVLQQLAKEPPLQFPSHCLLLHHRPQEKHKLEFNLLVFKL